MQYISYFSILCRRLIISRYVILISAVITLNCNTSLAYKHNYANLQFSKVELPLQEYNVHDMVRDKHGFLWIATYGKGLYKFDGIRYTLYSTNDKFGEALSSSFIKRLHADKAGNVWVAARNGLNLINQKTNLVTSFNSHSNFPLQSKRLAYHSIVSVSQNKVLALHNNGIIEIEHNTDNLGFGFKEILFEDALVPKTFGDYKFNLVSNSHNNIIFFLRDKLFIYDKGSYSPLLETLLNGRNINTIEFDRNDNLWIATDQELFRLDASYFAKEKNIVTERYSFNRLHITNVNGGQFVNEIHFDKKNNALLLTNNGLYILIRKDNSNDFTAFYHYTHDNCNPHSLISNQVIAINTDLEKKFYLCTHKGINAIRTDALPIKRVTTKDIAGKLPESVNIRSLEEDGKKNLWVGTYDNGVFINPRGTSKYLHLPAKLFMHGSIYDILWHNKSIWLCSYEPAHGKLYQIGTNNNNWLDNFNPKDLVIIEHELTIGQNQIARFPKTIMAKNRNEILIGTRENGILLFDIKNKKITKHYGVNADSSGMLDMKIISGFSRDSLDNVWVAKRGKGISLLNTKTDYVSNVFFQSNKNSFQAINKASDIMYQSNDKIWISTLGGGIISFNSNNNEYNIITKSEGIINNNLLSLILSGNYIWTSSLNGLSRINTENNNISNFYAHEIGNFSFNEKAAIKASGQRLIWGGLDGLLIINEKNLIQRETQFPNVLFSNLKVDFKSVIPGIDTNESVLTSTINQTKNIRLKSNNNLIIEFSTVSHLSAHQIYYQYKLDPINQDWVTCNYKNAYASYSQLPGGLYTFKVRASSSLQKWPEEARTLNIKVLPPFYKTKLVKIAIPVLLVIIIIAVLVFRTRIIRNRSELLGKLVDKRTRELTNRNQRLKELNQLLEQRNLQIEEQSDELTTQKEELEEQKKSLVQLNQTKDKLFSIISHDIKNPFNQILGFTEYMVNNIGELDGEQIEKNLGMLHESSSKVYQLLENLLFWSRSQIGKMVFYPERINLKEICDDTGLILKSEIDKKNNELINEFDSDVEIKADKIMFSAILRNLIGNANKFTDSGKIVVRYADKQDHHLFSVADTGAGMSEEEVTRLLHANEIKSTQGTSGEIGTGLGLIICKEFIEMHTGKMWIESIPENGTIVYFTFAKEL